MRDVRAEAFKILRCESEGFAEHAGEMKRVGETGGFGDLFDGGSGLLQALGGVIHLEAEEILIRAFVVVAPEQPAEVSFVDVTFPGDLFQRSQVEEVLFDVAATLLVGGERGSLEAARGGVRAGDFKGHAFEQLGASLYPAQGAILGRRIGEDVTARQVLAR